ncbi:MAG: hypothetical protein R3B70_35055 [Polyangiaceae bacterium]
MSGAARVSVGFVPREAPLAAVAAAGVGECARALGERLLGMDDATLSGLSGVAAGDAIVVLGEAEALPWVPEIVYLGRDLRAPRLLLPTALSPDVPVDVLERAIVKRCPVTPLAVIPSPRRLVPVGKAAPIARGLVEEWLSRWG